VEVLVTGGAGYIGSTVATALEHAGHVPIIIDSLLNGAVSSSATVRSTEAT
jgi:UDP-glucose 4-epimerase